MTAFKFEVRTGITGSDRNGWTVVAEYTDGAAAAEFVREQKDGLIAGLSMAIVRVAVDEDPAEAIDWRERERERFASGRYKRLPGDWQAEVDRSYPDHFAHVAESDSRKIAFTESEERGRIDRQKVLSAEEYVSRFFSGDIYSEAHGGYPWWGGSSRSSFLADMLGESVKLRMTPLGDADEMQRIYEECGGTDKPVGSCMGYDEDHFASSVHPVRVYALGGDLTLAYIREDEEGAEDLDDDSNPVAARCLVWPAEQLFGRVYSKQSYGAVLKAALRAKGYQERSTLTGARLGVIKDDNDAYVMPYVDGCQSFDGDPEEGFTIGGPHGAGNTNGYADFASVICEHCDEPMRPSDSYTVHVAEDSTEEWCHDCWGSEGAYCDRTEVRVTRYELVDVETLDRWGDQVTREWASWVADEHATLLDSGDWWRNSDISACDDCGSDFPRNELNGEDRCHSCQDAADEAEAEAAELVAAEAEEREAEVDTSLHLHALDGAALNTAAPLAA